MTDRPNGFGGENPCIHRKISVTRPGWLRKADGANRNMRTDASSGAPQYIISNPMGWFELGPVRGILPAMPADLPFPDYSGQALRSMWPYVEQDVSLINFVLELKDLKSIPGTVKSAKNLFKLLSGRGDINKSVSDVSNVYLQNEFGIQPFVRDVQSISTAVRSFEAKFRKYFAEQDTVLRRHYTTWYKPTSTPWPFYNDFTTLWGSPLTHYGRHTCGVPDVKYTATLVYSYSLPGLGPDSEHARELFLRDLLGINLNPKIVWDAIPFSFLIDYVFKVGTWLDQFATRNIEPQVVIWDYIESIRYSKSRDHWCYPWRQAKNGWCWCGNMTEEVYHRRTIVPDTYSAIQLSGLSSREILNMAALGGSRTRR